MKAVAWAAALGTLFSLVGPPGAAAQDTPDVVILTNGGRLRGTVISYEPGQPLEMRLLNGRDRAVPADQVAEVRFGGEPVRPSPAPAPEPVDEVSEAADPDPPRERPVAPRRAPSSEVWRFTGGRVAEQAADRPRDREWVNPWDSAQVRDSVWPDGPFVLTPIVVAGVLVGDDFDLPLPTAYLEAGAWLDYRPVHFAPYRLGVGLSASGQGATDELEMRGSQVERTRSPLAAIRLSFWPVVVDVFNTFAIRAGQDIALAFLPAGDPTWSARTTVDLAAQLSVWEIGVEVGFIANPIRYRTTSVRSDGETNIFLGEK